MINNLRCRVLNSDLNNKDIRIKFHCRAKVRKMIKHALSAFGLLNRLPNNLFFSLSFVQDQHHSPAEALHFKVHEDLE